MTRLNPPVMIVYDSTVAGATFALSHDSIRLGMVSVSSMLIGVPPGLRDADRSPGEVGGSDDG